MSTPRMIGLACVLLFAASLTMTLPGCGGGAATETNSDGTVKLAPGTVDLSSETGQDVTAKRKKTK